MPLASPPPVQSDLDLMAAVTVHDPQAERRLVERLAARVSRLARLLCGGAADADDAAQLSLLQILKSAGTFRLEMSLERWADRITARTTLRLAGRERQRRRLLARWLPPDMLPWGRRTQTASSEPLGLDGVLRQLTRERRQALVLRHALEYSVEEIADLTGAPVGTVKDRLVAGRKQLRALLEQDAEGVKGEDPRG